MSVHENPNSIAWRKWAAEAPYELLELFEQKQYDRLCEVRRRFPHDCGPYHPAYQYMKAESIDALNCLAHEIQEEYED